MGSGVSADKDTLKPLLLSQDLVDGSTRLAYDFPFRVSFTNYIKSGIWLDRLSRLVPETQLCTAGVLGGVSEYVTCDEMREEQDRAAALKASSKSEKYSKRTLPNSSKSTSISRYGRYADLYAGETRSFPQDELLIILFVIIYPIYLSSQEHERFVKFGIESGKDQDDHSGRSVASVSHRNSGMVQTNQSKRAQELLLNCAAHYDESFLQKQLAVPSWIQRVCAVFRDHTLALCITDTSRGGQPILFANNAFCAMFGFEEPELIGSDFSILGGPDTEMPQLKLMNGSIHSTETVKFAITLQTKAKKPVLDLIAQKAVGAFSVSTHFAKAIFPPEMLTMVDDVLLFLSYLVKAPALPVRPTWLPSPIAIMSQAAANVLLAASSSSARSHSSSFRPGHPNKKSKGGKGSTPTSARSFNNSKKAGSNDGSGSFRRSQRLARGIDTSGPRSYRSAGADAELAVMSEINTENPLSPANKKQNEKPEGDLSVSLHS